MQLIANQQCKQIWIHTVSLSSSSYIKKPQIWTTLPTPIFQSKRPNCGASGSFHASLHRANVLARRWKNQAGATDSKGRRSHGQWMEDGSFGFLKLSITYPPEGLKLWLVGRQSEILLGWGARSLFRGEVLLNFGRVISFRKFKSIFLKISIIISIATKTERVKQNDNGQVLS